MEENRRLRADLKTRRRQTISFYRVSQDLLASFFHKEEEEFVQFGRNRELFSDLILNRLTNREEDYRASGTCSSGSTRRINLFGYVLYHTSIRMRYFYWPMVTLSSSLYAKFSNHNIFLLQISARQQ